MIEKCPLGTGLVCSECDATEYLCHPIHSKNERSIIEKLDKLANDIKIALRVPSHCTKTNRQNLEHVYNELREILEGC